MTEKQEIVTWLRENRGGRLSLGQRFLLAWWALRYGELIYYSARLAAANLIEQDKHKTND